MRALFRRFGRDRRASIAILVGLMGVVFIGLSAIGIDGASAYLAKRRLQAATDMAAMAAASMPSLALARAGDAMAANGFPAASLGIVTGTYTADPTLSPADRFRTGPQSNAVRVTSGIVHPLIFGGALQLLLGASPTAAASPAGFTIRAVATARKQDVAALTLGSGVASLDGGLINGVLGALLGTRLSLSLLDYQALATANVDLFDMGDALATRLSLSGATYGSLTSRVTAQSAVFASLADAMASNPAAAAAVRGIAASLPTTATTSLASFVDYGNAATLAVGAPHPLTARVSALDALTALVRTCGAGHVASVDLGLSVPGLGSTQLMFSIGEPAQGSGYFAVGPESTVLHTAQVRLQLKTQLANPLLPASLALPLYLEVAPATATITGIACANGSAGAGVTLGVATGLASASIGTVNPVDLTNFAASPTVTPAAVIDIAGLLRVTASSQASIAAPGVTAVTFTAADIQAVVRKTVSTPVSLAALLVSLASSTRVTVTMLGITPPLPTLPALVQSTIASAVTPLDQLVGKLLPLFGLSVGNATTSVPGVRCGQGQLVN